MKINNKYNNIVNLNNFYNCKVNKYFSKIKKITDFILNEEKKNDYYIIEVNFVNNKIIKKINNDYRKKNKVTDVISLSFSKDGVLIVNNKKYFFLGEIYISIDKVKQQAKKYKNTFFYELFFLYIHGLLHLLGFDHIKKDDDIIMTKKLEEILKKNKWIKNS